ncbi:hypothetical protein [uncultured Methanobrevibacter sp.]|uniref:hypothetical protein n=1 Tax=uncultured Methanobrevibacter sp. TaxID=253161 RepID=UPI0025D96143|nr:hypothetical protein [uncultured Methanobrevibacter sp.]
MKKNFLFIICLILLIVSVSSVSASADVNQTIGNESGDSIALANDDGKDLGDNNLSYMSDINMDDNNLSYMSDINMDDDLSKLNISGVDFSSIDMKDIDLSKIDLSKIDLSKIDLKDIDLSKIDLSKIDLKDIDLSKIDFDVLSKIDLSGLNISDVLSKIDLSGLNISDVLSKIDLKDIDLSKIDLSGLNISDVLSKIDLSGLNISDFNPSDLADLTLSNVTKYYHGPERLEATYTILGQPIENVTIHFYVNDVEYKVNTSSAGKASIALNLNPGVYDVMARSLIIFQTATVTIKSTIEAKDIIKYYKNATQYYAKFVDGQGNLLKNTDVKFNINGVEYTRKTDASGVAKLNINLNSGTYIITATNPVTNEMRSNMIQVYGLIAENRDLTKYFKNESQYSIRLFDDQGNPVGAGVTALFNIHGVFYNRTSDENGYVKLNINLNPGDYIVTAEYNGYKVSNNIKVLPLLIASDLTKPFLDLTPFTVKLVNGHGNALIDKVITFNINGVMYNRTTDLSGIARLNINLWPGEYIITSMYEQMGAVTANKVTVTSIFG